MATTYVEHAVNNAVGFQILQSAYAYLCYQSGGRDTDAMTLLASKKQEIIHDPNSNQEALRSIIAVYERKEFGDLPFVEAANA